MLGTIGMQEILIILVVGIIIFGVLKMPKIARSLGTGFREYKKIKKGFKNGFDLDADTEQANQHKRSQPGQQYNPSMNSQTAWNPCMQGQNTAQQNDIHSTYQQNAGGMNNPDTSQSSINNQNQGTGKNSSQRRNDKGKEG